MQLTFNRLLTGEDIRQWVRGISRKPDARIWGWPSVSSVITASASQLLLLISLAMLVVALGMYLGHFGTAEPNGTKCVFVLYVIGFLLFSGVYSIAQSFDNEEVRSEIVIINGYLAEWRTNPPCQDEGNGHPSQTAAITARADDNSESDPLLKKDASGGETSSAITESIGRNSPTTPKSEESKCRDQAKHSSHQDLEAGNLENSISKSGSEASSKSRSSTKGKERVGKED